MLFLYALPIALLALIFEAYPRFFNRYCGVDIWTHLLYLKEFHKQKGIPKKIEGGFLVTGVYDYPPAFISIVSKFPIKLVEKYEFLFSPFFDAINLVLVFFFSYYLTQSIFISVLTQLLYLATPIIILENSSATPRSLGYSLFIIVFFSLFLFEQTHNILLLSLALIAGSLIFLSHRFTAQSFLFFCIFFSIITFNPLYILIFICSFTLAIMLSKGFYLKVLQGHIGNLIFWKKNIMYRFAHQIRGVNNQHKTTDFVFRLYNQFLRFPPFVLTITNPWVLSSLYYYFFTSVNDPVILRFGQIVIFSYILALITIWIPQLRFLGEGQRYLELSAFPAALLSSLLLQKVLTIPLVTFSYIVIGLSSFITIIVIQRKAIIKDTLRTLTPSLKSMYTYLKFLKRKPNLLCIPHQITTNTIYHTGCKVFVNADYTNIEKISDVYPYMKKPIRKIMKENNLEMILLNTQYAKITELKIGKYRVVKESDNYILLKPI